MYNIYAMNTKENIFECNLYPQIYIQSDDFQLLKRLKLVVRPALTSDTTIFWLFLEF
jgi:hypothetical protein